MMTPTSKKVSWTTLSNDKIFHRHSFACGVYKDRYILMAGQTAAMYDVVTRAHIPLPDLPFVVTCGVVFDDFFYVANPRERMHRISLSRRKNWEPIGKERELILGSMVTDGNHIYFISLIDLTIEIRRYDPSKDKVTSMRNYFFIHSGFATAVIDRKIYIIGGIAGVNVFDIVTRTWGHAPPLPKQLSFANAVAFDKWIVVTGGKTVVRGYYVQENDKAFIFDTHTQRWTTNNVVSTPCRLGNCCVRVGSQIISVGGWNKEFKYCPIEAIQIKYLLPDWSWETIKPYVMLRALVDENRAAPSTQVAKKKHAFVAFNILWRIVFGKKRPTQTITTDEKLKQNILIQKSFTDLPLDVFRNIISFMIGP